MTERQFHTAYLSLAETLYRIAFYMLESEAEAEDALQELYLKLWDNRDSLDGVRSPKAYSITLLKNLCLDRIPCITTMITATTGFSGSPVKEFTAAGRMSP